MVTTRLVVDQLSAEVVGRRREAELVVAALAADRHVLLEGPPGTGKSTLLRGVASAVGLGFEFVEGTAELTPARLIGHFDPALVLAEGYSRRIAVIAVSYEPSPRIASFVAASAPSRLI